MASTIACSKNYKNISFCSKNIRTLTFAFRFLVLLIAVTFSSHSTLFADEHDTGFSIQSLETLMQNRVYLLNANLSYKFSKDAIEALEHGVPLLILVNIEILTPRWYWSDKSIAKLEQGYLLLYHALSDSYVVNNLNSGTQNNFTTLNQALQFLSHIKKLPVLDANLLNSKKEYYLRVRAHLDIESLPAPMRPLAYISSDWQLSSDWYEWPMQQ